MNILLLNIALAFIWAALIGAFNFANLSLGFALGYLILFLIRRAIGPTVYFSKVRQVIGFMLFMIWELLIANLRVAGRVLSPRHQLRPHVIAIPLDTDNETEITLLANLVSLTPGTLSLDVSSDLSVLYVHTLYQTDPEELRIQIKTGFERKVIALMRGAITDGKE